MHEEIIARAAEIVATEGYCALALIDTDGYPTVATISPSKKEGIECITFCTGIDSNWVKRIKICNRASICFNSKCNITLVGTIEVLTDLETKKEMWYEGMGWYFSGPEDSGFCVLRFKTQRYSLMLNEKDGTFRGTL